MGDEYLVSANAVGAFGYVQLPHLAMQYGCLNKNKSINQKGFYEEEFDRDMFHKGVICCCAVKANLTLSSS